MGNTLENKAKFFGQYWGQQLLKARKNDELTWIIGLGGNNPVKQDFLELTPLSSITDEDAIEVVNMIMSLGMRSSSMRNPKKYCINSIGKTLYQISDIVDYLRSKGYALPYMGLSVEKLIEYGWIKLKN